MQLPLLWVLKKSSAGTLFLTPLNVPMEWRVCVPEFVNIESELMELTLKM